jgi:hypothetical protein
MKYLSERKRRVSGRSVSGCRGHTYMMATKTAVLKIAIGTTLTPPVTQ